MNEIPEAQNRKENIQLLKAQRHLYSLAKRFAFVNFLISIPLIVALSFVAKEVPSFEPWYACISLAVLVAGQILRHFAESRQEYAAQVQGMFDSKVLEVKTNDFFTTSKVSLEEIKRHADRISIADNKGLEDWYPVAVSALPITYARLVCQRANCYWNFTQRSRYIFGLIGIAMTAGVVVLTVGLTMASTLNDLMLFIFLPLLPVINWGAIEIGAHQKSLKMLSCLKTSFERIMEDVLAKRISEREVELRTIQIQDTLYIRRANDPLVPGKLYWLFRDYQEAEMQFSADALITQINQVI